MLDKLIENGCVVCKNCRGDCLTTIKIGGRIKCVAYPTSKENACKCIDILNEFKETFFIIGNGSNILISDTGFEGTAVCTKKMKGVFVEGFRIYAEAGAKLPELANLAKNNSLKGLEFASGIPATVGGGVAMNCGAYGSEISDIVEYADIYLGGKVERLSRQELNFSYRHSILQEENAMLLNVCLLLSQGEKATIEEKMQSLNKQRALSQPQQPSIGSVFARGEENGVTYLPAKLIDELGLKGKSIKGVKISDKHAGFIVNVGEGRAKDFANLVDFIVEKVYNKYKINLRTEVKFVGRFEDFRYPTIRRLPHPHSL